MDKQQQRKIAYAARNAQADKDGVSAEICRRISSTAWYQTAQVVLWYVHCRSEVRTVPMLSEALNGDKHIVVPYCTVDADGEKQLGLWRLKAIEELVPGMWNILEPPWERRSDIDRVVDPEALDAVIVPGVAFDRHGGRLGNGAGYYDRLLKKVRADAVLAAIGYESQLLPEVAMDAHDVCMDFVITENEVYQGRRFLQR